ncbi:MAG TPA: hypothetical protein VNF69_10895, partial [Burkholderiales bacterium]|nr:hypothetical protein [Burkholderiales bacterium]
MSESVAGAGVQESRADAPPAIRGRAFRSRAGDVLYPVVGVAVLLALWWVGGEILYLNHTTRTFAGLGPVPTFRALFAMLADGTIGHATASSLYRVGIG